MNICAKKFNRSGAIKNNNLFLIEYCNLLKSKYRLNKRVLLVQIPQLVFKSFNPEVVKKKGYYVFPPTGLQYLYEAIKKRDLDIKILDLNFMLLKKVFEEDFDYRQWIDILKEYVDDFDPAVIGVSCMYDLGIQPLMEVLKFLRQRNRSVIITGGVIPTYEGESLQEQDLCHFVIEREGEDRINFLLDYLTDENLNSDPCSGVRFKHNGFYCETEGNGGEVIFDTDLIDSYSLVNIREYCKYGSLNPFSRIAGLENSPFAAIQMNRGCRAMCTFCSVRDFIGKGVRKRSVEKILSEMDFLINKCGVRHFEWLDDDLLYYKKEFQNLLQKIIDKKWEITWSANNGLIASSIDDEMMRLIRDSGCIGFKIGIETGNVEKLKEIKKPATLDIFRKAAKIFEQYAEVFIGGNFMLGFPHEKFYQMMDSFRFSLELNLDWSAFTTCQAIRGATAFSEFEDHFISQIKSEGENVKNFIPTRESSKGQLAVKKEALKGLDVFKLDPKCEPDADQIKEIWFTFNLVGNYINNKNLRRGGNPEKFISWVEMAQVAYPINPYMSLFLSLAYIIKEDFQKAEEYFQKATLSYRTDYWQERFAAFKLDRLMRNFPKNKAEVFEKIDDLRSFFLTVINKHSYVLANYSSNN